MPEWWHGTRRGYDIERCRCVECRACNADRVRRWRAARPRRRPHPWRERVVEEWSLATQSWWEQREAASLGYATEAGEFEQEHPRPRLSDFMAFLSTR